MTISKSKAALEELKLADYEREDRSVGLLEGYSLGLSVEAYKTIRTVLEAHDGLVEAGMGILLGAEPDKPIENWRLKLLGEALAQARDNREKEDK